MLFQLMDMAEEDQFNPVTFLVCVFVSFIVIMSWILLFKLQFLVQMMCLVQIMTFSEVHNQGKLWGKILVFPQDTKRNFPRKKDSHQVSDCSKQKGVRTYPLSIQ